jgi:hypothetical protein
VSATALLAKASSLHALPVLIWLGGIVFYHLSSRYTPALGAALPTLVLTFAAAWWSRPAAAE